MDDPLLANLTRAQQEAVLHVDGPLLNSGGSRKRQDARRHAPHCQLVAIGRSPATHPGTDVYQQGGRGNAPPRVERLAPRKPVWVSTFHRFCAKLLREHGRLVGLEENFTIYDTSDSQSTLKRTIELLDIDTGHFTPQQIAHHISWAKNNLIPAAQYQPRPGHPLGAITAKIYPAYQQALLQANAVDFDDMLLHVAMLLRESPGGAHAPRRTLPLYSRRRVSRHESGPIRNRPCALDGLSESVGYRRSGPVDLRLARGELEQHPRV